MISPRIRDAGTFLVSLALLFGIVYNVNFQVCPPLSTGRLAIIYLLWEQRKELPQRLREASGRHPYLLLLMAGLLVHATIGYIVGGRVDGTQMSRQFHFFLYSLLGAVLYSGRVKGDVDAFMRNMTIVTAAQGAMILYSMFAPEYRQWLASVVVQSGHLDIVNAARPPGFTTSSGSNLSVIQSLGVFAGLWTISKARRMWARLPACLGVLACVLSTLVTGRTGLMLSGIFYAAYVVRALSRFRFAFALSSAIVLAAAVLAAPRVMEYLAGMQQDGMPNFERLGDWAFEFFLNEGDVYSVQDLKSMPIPPISLETLTGTGMVETNLRMGSGNDSGYIQNYFSLGLCLAILLYGGLLAFFGAAGLRSPERFLALILVAGLFVIEAKEPFIFKYIYAFFLLTPYFARVADSGREGAAA
jgi:hypothetical protein